MTLPSERLSLAQLLRRDARGGVLPLFAGRRSALTYSTRVAIRAACDVLGLTPGDEVLVPAYNCGSEVDPLLQAGLIPVLYPVGADTAVDPAHLAALITPCTKALYLTHYFGFPQPRTADLRALCDAHGLALMEDCALNLLSQGRAEVGLLGDVAFFCLYKYFPVNAGGVLVVNRADLLLPTFAARPRLRPAATLVMQALAASLLGDRGVAALTALRHKLRPPRLMPPRDPARLPDMPGHYYFDPALIGTRISTLATRPLAGVDVQATIALRRRNYRAYLDLLSGLDGVRPLFPDLPEGVCPLNMPVLVDHRDQITADLYHAGIAVASWWGGYHKALDYTPFTEARHLKDHVLALPLYPGLEPQHLQSIVALLAALLAKQAPDQSLARFQAPE